MTSAKMPTHNAYPPTVRFAVHGLIGSLYVYITRMIGRMNWAAVDLPTISQVDVFLEYMLTSWTLKMHLGFFLTAAFLDFSELLPQSIIVSKLLNTIRKVNDFFFITVMLPISMCVCTGFWFGWILDNEGVCPTEMNDIIPLWINHASHTTPIFVVFFELIFCYHPSPRFKPAITTLLTFDTFYLLTLITLRIHHGRWVYLLIDIHLNTIPRVFVCFSWLCYIIPTLYLASCLRFNNRFWGIKPYASSSAERRSKKKN